MIWLAWATSSTVQPIHVACHVIAERIVHDIVRAKSIVWWVNGLAVLQVELIHAIQ